MTLVLGNWNREWQPVLFDTETGKGHPQWLPRRSEKRLGWALKKNGRWYAVWSDGAQMIFQSGLRRIPMASNYRCRDLRFGSMRRFTVETGNETIYTEEYRALDRDNDPAYDLADLQQDDFFYFAASLWNDGDWQREAVQNWAPAVASDRQ